MHQVDRRIRKLASRVDAALLARLVYQSFINWRSRTPPTIAPAGSMRFERLDDTGLDNVGVGDVGADDVGQRATPETRVTDWNVIRFSDGLVSRGGWMNRGWMF